MLGPLPVNVVAAIVGSPVMTWKTSAGHIAPVEVCILAVQEVKAPLAITCPDGMVILVIPLATTLNGGVELLNEVSEGFIDRRPVNIVINRNSTRRTADIIDTELYPSIVKYISLHVYVVKF